MYKFAIKNKFYGDKTVGHLFYDENTQNYHIKISDNVKSAELPLLLAAFIEKGEYEIGSKWSRRWVQERVIPPNRQNIGQILKKNGMEF